MIEIEHGHTHLFVAWDDFTRRNGIRVIWSRCVCGLEERRLFAEDEPQGIQYRIGGIWVDALLLLRVSPLRVAECDVCGGDPDPRVTQRCHRCLGVGVIEGDGPVKLNPPSKYTEPEPAAEQDEYLPRDHGDYGLTI